MSGLVAVRPFPALTVSTPRLLVRALTGADAKQIGVVFSDRMTRRWLPFDEDAGPIDGLEWCTEEAQERRDSGAGDHLGIVRREDDRLIGSLWTKRTDWAGRVTEVCVALEPAARGYGLAAEAVIAVSFALIMEHGFARLEIRVPPGNVAARRVAEKAGFSYEGVLRSAGHVLGARADLEVWSLVAADLR
ncbi:GNAT family N-acetyltransferase [Catenuloplanes atrovinosus]|uniref:RimJ/RimL family protein N-acetyltransferase n=1 Tax=Catenuloplanes atrovinosus TaxID=137266 RepID=A0AAE3YUP8_9ACTN|nr:GNAT family protein [Catenuloplanes atrovinosus]MDR7278769.1 RimJ/RimL family protein N-acetyltransferase [Catenuloplanes atrovinosus]